MYLRDSGFQLSTYKYVYPGHLPMNGTELDSLLRSLAEPGYRDFSSKLLPGTEGILGVRMPKLRSVAKDICKGDWREFLTYPSASFEHTMIRGFVIATAKTDMTERIELIEQFLPEIDNWSVNDGFCCSLKVKELYEKKMLWDYCVGLVNRHQEFPSRVGAVLMLWNFIDAEHVDEVNRLLVSCPRCGYYLDMGIAWTLSESFVHFPERTEEVIFDGRLDDTVLRMTVRKICDSFRVEPETKKRLKERLGQVTQKSS